MIAIVVMVVGIGFLTLLIVASAERFVAKDVARAELDIEEFETDVLHEIEEIA